MFAILVVLLAMVFTGMVVYARNHKLAAPVMIPVPVDNDNGPRVGERVRYTDGASFRGYAYIQQPRRQGLITLRHSDHRCARPFSVHPSRILN